MMGKIRKEVTPELIAMKLPNWAQRHIEMLEMHLKEANADLDKVRGVATVQNRIIVPDTEHSARPLMDRDRIVFFLHPAHPERAQAPADEYDRVAIRVRLAPEEDGDRCADRVEVSTSSGLLQIYPQMGNVIHVGVEDRFKKQKGKRIFSEG